MSEPRDEDKDPARTPGSGSGQDPAAPEPDADRPTLEPDGTWTDDATGQSGPVISDRAARIEQQRHRNSLQLILLIGVGSLIVFMVLVLVVTAAAGGITEDFAATLAQMTIPTLLTFGGAIVGTLFGTSGTSKQAE